VNPPPYRLETERLVVRCYDPRDAAALKDAVDSSLDHLRPWMPWAYGDPQPLEQKVELLRTFRGNFDLGNDFVYGIFERDESRLVGGTGLHTRVGADALEVGYWIRADAVGRGYATEVTAALAKVAFDVCGVDRVELHVEPANDVSARIPRKLGFVEEARMRRRLYPGPDGRRRDVVVYTMFGDDVSPAVAAARFDAFDAAGVRLA
jgi:RimJ/RimL family protein N-acetyltransferase